MKRYITIDMAASSENDLSILEWIAMVQIEFASNNDKGYCFAKKETLAVILQVSRSTVFRLINSLGNLSINVL